jgi:hypothetical protein
MKSLLTCIAIIGFLGLPMRNLLASPDLTYEEWEKRYRSFLGSTGASCKDPTLSSIAGTIGKALSRHGTVVGPIVGGSVGHPYLGALAGILASSIGDALQQWNGWICYCITLDWTTDIFWLDESGEFTGRISHVTFHEPCCMRMTLSTFGARGEKCYAPAPNEKACIDAEFTSSSGGTNQYWCPR